MKAIALLRADRIVINKTSDRILLSKETRSLYEGKRDRVPKGKEQQRRLSGVPRCDRQPLTRFSL